MQIDYDNSQDKTGKNGFADHAAAAGQDVHEATRPGRSKIAKLLVWPHSKPTQSETPPEETKQRPNQTKSDEHDVECVGAVSRRARSGFKRRLVRMSLLVVVLTSAVMTGYFTIPSLRDYGLKGVLYRLLSFVASGQGGEATGQVTGIIHSDDKPSAVIGSSLVHEGDTLYGVRIVKVNSNNVEFEMDGQTWSQRLREKPSKHWPDSLLNSTK
jgi:hypothetical protein